LLHNKTIATHNRDSNMTNPTTKTVDLNGKQYEVRKYPAGTPGGCAAGWTAVWTRPANGKKAAYVSCDGRLGKQIIKKAA
jgi:hypothetical protein